MRVVALVGSARKDGVTNFLVERLFSALRSLDPAVETEKIHPMEARIDACRVSCSHHCSANPYQCSNTGDDFAAIFKRLQGADAVVLGCPLYFKVPAAMNALVERMISLAYHCETKGADAVAPLGGKPCALVAVAEYTDPFSILEYLQNAALCLKMKPVVLGRYPYLGVGCIGRPQDDKVLLPLERVGELASALISAHRASLAREKSA